MMHKFNTDKHSAMDTMKGINTNGQTDLNLICPRAINKYRYDENDFKSLINSIKQNGLFKPITLNRIDKYLNSEEAKNLSKEEYDYYQRNIQEGRLFFVSDGHRRFYAYCSICVNKNITSVEDMEEFYQLYQLEKEKNESLGVFDLENINQYLSIKSEIVRDDFWKERRRYNSANLDQRAIIDFEIVDNAIDNMKLEKVTDDEGNEISRWDFESNKIKTSVIDSMKDRAIVDLIERIINSNESIERIKNCPDGDKLIKELHSFKSTKDARKILKLLPIEVMPRYKKEQVISIQEYINNVLSKEISFNSIDKCRQMLNMYPKDLISLIYSGILPFRDAKNLLTVYKYLPNDFAQELAEILKEKENYDLKNSPLSAESKEFYMNVVVKGKFNIEKAKKILLDKDEKKKIALSQSDLLNLFKEINSGKKTFEQVYDYLKELNLV